MNTQKKAMTVAGWAISGLIGLALTGSAVMKLMNSADVVKELVDRLGYPRDVTQAIGVLELACLVVFLIPRTSILGAVLLTGYFGGAVATHVRIHDNFLGPVIGGILVWLALYLRDLRVRALLPIRQQLASTDSR